MNNTLFTLGLLFEFLILIALAKSLPIYIPLILHSISFILISIGYYRLTKRETSYTMSVLFFALVIHLLFPIISILGFAVLFIASRSLQKMLARDTYRKYKSHIRRKGSIINLKKTPAQELRNIKNEIGFESFIDIIQGRDAWKKKHVVDKLCQNITKNNVKLLKEAISDKSPEVRFYAADALIKIEDYFTENIGNSKDIIETKGHAKDYEDLGKLYYQYASIGLLEIKDAKFYYGLSRDALQNSLDYMTGQPDVILQYIDCMVNLELYSDAERILTGISKIWPDNIEITFAQASIYFYSGHIEKALPIIKSLALEKDLPKEQKEAVAFWTEN